jgi:hypothetical protein
MNGCSVDARSNVFGRVDYIVRSSAQVRNAKLALWVLLTDGKTGEEKFGANPL